MDIYFFGNFIFLLGAGLVIAATFSPDRRPVKPKLNQNDFFEIVKRDQFRFIPTTAVLSIAALTISMGMIFADGGETAMGYPLVAIGSLFAVAEITSRLKDFKKDSFRPFSGFLIPAIVLLYVGFIWTHDIWLKGEPRGYLIGSIGAALAALDLKLKLKKPNQ